MNFIMEIVGWPLGWVMWLAYYLCENYLLALLIFTLIMRFVMVPFSVKQYKNNARMALFRPKIDAINKKYGDNREKAQEEINKLYEKEGYNPFGGCSTMLIQLPVLYGLIDVVYKPLTHVLRISKADISAVQKIIEAGEKAIDKDFAFRSHNVQLSMLEYLDKYKDQIIDEVGAPIFEKMANLDLVHFGIDFSQTPTWAFNMLVLIPILSFVTALASSIISMKMGETQTEGQAKGCSYAMMLGMPLMSAYFSTIVPAGVGVYWIFGNIFAGVQSIVLKKIITPEKVAAKLEADRKKGKKQKKSKLMSKLIEAQEQAAAQNGAYSEKEKAAADAKKAAQKEAQKKKGMTDQQRLAEARRRYDEKYGD